MTRTGGEAPNTQSGKGTSAGRWATTSRLRRAAKPPRPAAPTEAAPARPSVSRSVVPGEILLAAEPVRLNPGRPVTLLTVRNTADRPVTVGSHLHFAAANDALDFDRDAAWGLRPDIPAGTAVRFEPGAVREVALVPIAGARVVPGLHPGRGGPLDTPAPSALPTANTEPRLAASPSETAA